jgi:hypothetical protein
VSHYGCCERKPLCETRDTPVSFIRRSSDIAGWATGLAFLPKCPACLAAYILIGTGASLSIATAANLRIELLTLCAISLSYYGAILVRHLFGLASTARRQRDVTGAGDTLDLSSVR